MFITKIQTYYEVTNTSSRKLLKDRKLYCPQLLDGDRYGNKNDGIMVFFELSRKYYVPKTMYRRIAYIKNSNLCILLRKIENHS